MRFRTCGRDIRRSTGIFPEREARDQAWQIFLHESGQGVGPAPALRRNTYPLLGQICNIYVKGIADYTSIQPASSRKNMGNLLAIAREVYPLKEPRELRCNILTRDFVIEWICYHTEKPGE